MNPVVEVLIMLGQSAVYSVVVNYPDGQHVVVSYDSSDPNAEDFGAWHLGLKLALARFPEADVTLTVGTQVAEPIESGED